MFKHFKSKIDLKSKLINIHRQVTDASFLTLPKYKLSYSYYFKQFRNIQFFDNVPCRLIIEDNYYTTKQPLIFKNGKLPLMNAVNSNLININLNISKTFTSLIIILSTCAIITFYKFSIIISSIFAISALSICFLKFKLHKTFYRIIIQLNLMENGKFLEIVTLANKFEVDIKFLNKPSRLQISTFNLLFPDFINIFNPLIIENGSNKGLYLIPSDENIYYNKELINAAIYKSYIVGKNKIGKNDIIIENNLDQ